MPIDEIATVTIFKGPFTLNNAKRKATIMSPTINNVSPDSGKFGIASGKINKTKIKNVHIVSER